jgi:predicted XRE-type DNA-binding protein
MDQDMIVHDSSGNVFADMGMSNAEERLAKAELARVIRRAIRERDLVPDDVGRDLGLSAEDVADLLRGKLTHFSRIRLAILATEASRWGG